MKEFPQDTLKTKVRKARMFIQIVCRGVWGGGGGQGGGGWLSV